MIMSFTNLRGGKNGESIMMKSNPVRVNLWSLICHGPAVEILEIVPKAEIELRKPRGMNG